MLKNLLVLSLVTLVIGCEKRQEIHLERIVFHTSPCYGSCPVYHLEINKYKTVSLFAARVYKIGDSGRAVIDSAKTGYYIGKVSDQTFKALERQLYMANIDGIDANSILCCDGTTKTLIIDYNGRRKKIKTMFPKSELNTLINTLLAVCEQDNFKKVEQRFIISE